MNAGEFVRLSKENFDKRMIISSTKRADYTATSEDCLSNFKRVSFICEILGINFSHVSDSAMFFIVHKMDREMQLKKSGIKPENESRKDTLLDLANYVDLYIALVKEESSNAY